MGKFYPVNGVAMGPDHQVKAKTAMMAITLTVTIAIRIVSRRYASLGLPTITGKFYPVNGAATGLYRQVKAKLAMMAIVSIMMVAHPSVRSKSAVMGYVQTNETCDDGNTADGDGCDATCQTEPTT